FFVFSASATSLIYTLSLHDALPISRLEVRVVGLLVGPVVDHAERPDALGRLADQGRERGLRAVERVGPGLERRLRGLDVRHVRIDRKSTRLNSSHLVISYAVFCLKK